MKNFCRGLMLLAMLMVAGLNHTPGQTIPIQGEQSGLMQADTVLITGNVTIPEGATLTFLPGTTILSTGFFGLDVRGALVAEGMENNGILFSVTDTTGFHNLNDSRGGWNGIRFSTTGQDSDSSVFRHCTFEYGKAFGDSLERYGGVFNIRNFSRIRISDCSFRYNKAVFWGGAIFAEYSDLLISRSVFTDNFCGTPGPPYGYGGAVCLRYSAADITGCLFHSNRSTGIGGAVSCEYSDVMMVAGEFTDNYSGLGGALGYLRSVPQRPVSTSLFTGNSSLFFGGGIACIKANPRFINNTITENYSYSYGGGFYCNDSAVPVMMNTILYGNHAPEGQQVYIWDVSSAPEFYYCNVQGGAAAFGGTGGVGYNAPYLNNLDTLPLFSGIQPYPYALADNSPCVNAGNPDTTGLMLPATDLAGNPRIHAGAIDIGCYENQSVPASVNVPGPEKKPHCYPNPFHDEITIIVPEHTCNLTMIITAADGRLIFRQTGITGNRISWNPEHYGIPDLKPGLYHITILSAEAPMTTTVMYRN